jgi:hypothetical protein
MLYDQPKDASTGEVISNREMIRLLKKNPGFSNGDNFEQQFKTRDLIHQRSPRETISSQVNTLLKMSNQKNPFV